MNGPLRLRVALGLGLALVLLAPLPLGGTGPLARGLLGMALALIVALTWSARRFLGRPPARFAGLLIATMVLVVAHLAPWPASLVQSLSPAFAEQAQRSLSFPGEPSELAEAERSLAQLAGGRRPEPRWSRFAVDRDGAVKRCLELLLAMAAFATGLLAVNGENARRLVCSVIATSAFFQAAYGLAEALSGHHQIFGYSKIHYLPLPTGTFICPNHFAALLSLGAFSIAALISPYREREGAPSDLVGEMARTVLVATLGVVVLFALIWSSSRAALAAAGAAGLILGALAWWQRREAARAAGVRGSVGVPAVVGLVALALIAGAVWLRPPLPLVEDVERLDEQVVAGTGRPLIWKTTVEIIRDHPLLGTGLGGYRYVHPQYRPPESNARVLHAHSDYLEWWAESGVPGVLLLMAWLAGLISGVRTLLSRRAGRWLTSSIALGLLALAFHEAVDFSLQLPGVALPAAMLTGALLSPLPWRPRQAAAESHATLWSAALAGLLIGLAALSLHTLATLRPAPLSVEPSLLEAWSTSADGLSRRAREQVRLAVTEPDGSKREALDRLGPALLALQRAARHAPLREPVQISSWLAAQALVSAHASGGPTPERFDRLTRHYLERAEQLAPASRRGRLTLLRHWMLAGDPRQARRVARALLDDAPHLAEQSYALLGGGELSLGELMQATPNRPDAALRLARYLLRQRGDRAAAQIVLERALARGPGEARLVALLASVLIDRGRLDSALALLDDAPETTDDRERLALLRTRARALAALGRGVELDRALETLERAGEDARLVALLRSRALIQQHRSDEAIEALRWLLDAGGPPLKPERRLEALLLLGSELERQLDFSAALKVFREAERIDPDHPRIVSFFDKLRRSLEALDKPVGSVHEPGSSMSPRSEDMPLPQPRAFYRAGS
ncbi:MAG: O-antigen ligase family protein [Acidobacteriota bacterium]|nr:MAG: O-antigen ligase family protein [Acidobacteriota bacterium]